MTDRLTQSELESYLWGAATILRGLVDAGDYKQYIFPLLSASHNCTSHLWGGSTAPGCPRFADHKVERHHKCAE